jgi:hypothetical protein
MTEGQFISPNEALKRAVDLMLHGRKPETPDDWTQVMNCIAANTPTEAAESVCLVMKALFDIPLEDDFIREIVTFQNEHS